MKEGASRTESTSKQTHRVRAACDLWHSRSSRAISQIRQSLARIRRRQKRKSEESSKRRKRVRRRKDRSVFESHAARCVHRFTQPVVFVVVLPFRLSFSLSLTHIRTVSLVRAPPVAYTRISDCESLPSSPLSALLLARATSARRSAKPNGLGAALAARSTESGRGVTVFCRLILRGLNVANCDRPYHPKRISSTKHLEN